MRVIALFTVICGLLLHAAHGASAKEIQRPLADLQIFKRVKVTKYDFRWNDKESGNSKNLGLWHPKPPAGHYVFGSIGLPNHSNPNGKTVTYAYKPLIKKIRHADFGKNPVSVVVHPVDYRLLWTDKGSGSTNSGSLWAPVAPKGYLALGNVANKGYGKPALSDAVCMLNAAILVTALPKRDVASVWLGGAVHNWKTVWKPCLYTIPVKNISPGNLGIMKVDATIDDVGGGYAQALDVVESSFTGVTRSWRSKPGRAKFIGTGGKGPHGRIYRVGTDKRLSQYNPVSNKYVDLGKPNVVEAIVTNVNDIWTVNTDGSLSWYIAAKGGWAQLHAQRGRFTAARSGGSKVLFIKKDGSLHEFTGTGLRALTQTNVQDAAITRDDHAWIVKKDHTITRFVNGTWQKIAGSAKSITAGGVGSSEQVLRIGTDDRLYKWNGRSWTDTGKTNVATAAVARHGEIWIVKKDGRIEAYEDTY